MWYRLQANNGNYYIKEENYTTSKLNLASDLETSFTALLVFPQDVKDMCLEYKDDSSTFLSKYSKTLNNYVVLKKADGTNTLVKKRESEQPEYDVTGINYISNDTYSHPEREFTKSNYEYEYCGEIKSYENFNLGGEEVFYIRIGTENYDLLNFSEGLDFHNLDFELSLEKITSVSAMAVFTPTMHLVPPIIFRVRFYMFKNFPGMVTLDTFYEV